MTVRRWLEVTRDCLQQAGVESASLEAQLLACHVLMVGRPWLLAHPEAPFPELAGQSLLERRLSGEPLAYILGRREFFGRNFVVRPGVLIPRQETEILVERALAYAKRLTDAHPLVLDLGTGSGCIAVTLKLEAPRLTVVASDLSEKALEIAEENAARLQASVTFCRSDAFAGLGRAQFDMVVTNPPYIGLQEPLAREVKDFEPASALFSGITGYEFYDRLALDGKAHLKPGGWILMEVGYRQAAEVQNLFQARGWVHVETAPDLSGIARVVICEA